MRRIIVVLAILASTVFLLGASAPTASAGNCQVTMGFPWVDAWNYVNVQGILKNCTGVSAIKFMWDSSHLEGFWDKTECPGCVYGNLHYYTLSAPTVPTTVTGVQQSGVYGVTYKTYGWCSPGAIHSIASGFWYQICSINLAGCTWGPAHDFFTTPTSQHCGNV
jgi:hypothetical protein